MLMHIWRKIDLGFVKDIEYVDFIWLSSYSLWHWLEPLLSPTPGGQVDAPSFQPVSQCLAASSEKAMATHSSTVAWKIPWMEEPGRLQSMGSWRVRHDWVTSLSLFTFMHWRRKWQPTPVFLPGESQGRESGGLPSRGSHRVGHDWSDLAAAAAASGGFCWTHMKSLIPTY